MTTTLPTRSKDTIVANIAAGIQGRVSAFLNFAVGSVFLAVAEAVAGVCLWLQAMALAIVKLTRLSTSFGSDVDSFIADFPLSGVERLSAQPATGLCAFSRYTAGPSTVYVPVGGQVKTTDGSQAFQVYADTGNAAFVASYVPPGQSIALGGYAMLPQVTSVVVPVRSITAGTTGSPGLDGNVAAGSISLVSSSMPGVDTVTNPAGFTNGLDVEGDVSLKGRFALAVRGRSGGTVLSIRSAIANLGVGLTCVVLQGQSRDGTANPGMVSVIVDDGSGNLSSALLATAQAVVSSDTTGVHAAGVRTGVYAATVKPITIVMQVATAPGYVHQDVVAQVTAAVTLFVNGLGQNATVSYFAVGAAAMAVPGVVEIVPNSYTLNGGTTDVAASAQTTPKITAATVS